MTKLLDLAVETARRLSPTEQDEIARVVMALAGDDQLAMTPLTRAEQAAIARSKAAAARGKFASDAEVNAVWAKHKL